MLLLLLLLLTILVFPELQCRLAGFQELLLHNSQDNHFGSIVPVSYRISPGTPDGLGLDSFLQRVYK